MATEKLNPLPPDYVRPSLAEFLAASKAHTTAEHLPWCQRYEAALRRHSAPALAADSAPAPAALNAPATRMGDPDQPWEYVRDAGGIITGTRELAAAPSAEAVAEPVTAPDSAVAEPVTARAAVSESSLNSGKWKVDGSPNKYSPEIITGTRELAAAPSAEAVAEPVTAPDSAPAAPNAPAEPVTELAAAPSAEAVAEPVTAPDSAPAAPNAPAEPVTEPAAAPSAEAVAPLAEPAT